MRRGYRSDTEYCFEEEHADAIIRTTTYHRKDYCLSMIWYSPREHAEILPSIATSFQRTSDLGLGSLDRLPLELVLGIFYRLDLHSLLKFRQISLRARRMVDSLTQYQRVISYGLNLLCALLRTGFAMEITLLDLYDALCTKCCTHCGEFAGFINLFTWRRYCFKCFQESPETQVRTLTSVRKHLQLTKPELKHLKTFKALPGTYSMNETVQKARIAIVSLYQATLICGRTSPELTDLKQTGFNETHKFNFMGSCALPYYDKETDTVDHGVSCAGCQEAINKDIITPRVEWGYEARDKVYGRDSFLEHFKWCEQAQILWESSEQGRKRPRELARLDIRGGFFKRRE